jgi:hypothetical protein
MAARRLLIVMLVLLGISTLAAALVPQSTLNDDSSTRSTTPTTTTTSATNPPPAPIRPTKITVGGKRFPVISPVQVGMRLTLLVRSRHPAQIAIPEFGQIGFATPNTPARFELLADTPGTFGILFASTGKVAAQIRVVEPGAKAKKKRKAKRRAREGSGRP